LIECDLEEIPEFEMLSSNSKLKRGRYHGSMFWNVPGFGKSKWIIAARILFDDNVTKNIADEQIIEGCMEFLNTPPPRKKFQRRILKPKYGKLELHSGKILTKDNKSFISALLITDKRKSKHFWGKGIVTTK
jgi:hypothetical protein